MKYLSILFLTFSFQAFSQGEVELTTGGSITIDGTKISCVQGIISKRDAIMGLNYAEKLGLLQTTGIGNCYVQKKGGVNFFYSARYNGINVMSGSAYIINNSIENGDCGI